MFYFQAVTIFFFQYTFLSEHCIEVFILYSSFEFFRVKYAGRWTQTINKYFDHIIHHMKKNVCTQTKYSSWVWKYSCYII